MSGLPPGGTGWRKEGKAPARQRRHSPVRRYAPRRQPRGVTQAGRAGVVEAWPLTVSTRDAGGRARGVRGAVTRTRGPTAPQNPPLWDFAQSLDSEKLACTSCERCDPVIAADWLRLDGGMET